MKNEFDSEKFDKIMESEDEDAIIDYLKNETSKNFVEDMYNHIREKRLNRLFEELGIDKEKYEKVRKNYIELSPKSKEYPLFSTLYKKHDGKYKVEDLIYEFHDSILKEGMEIGLAYGQKFLVEDIQNKRFSKEELKNLNEKELREYYDENREEI